MSDTNRFQAALFDLLNVCEAFLSVSLNLLQADLTALFLSFLSDIFQAASRSLSLFWKADSMAVANEEKASCMEFSLYSMADRKQGTASCPSCADAGPAIIKKAKIAAAVEKKYIFPSIKICRQNLTNAFLFQERPARRMPGFVIIYFKSEICPSNNITPNDIFSFNGCSKT
jgi:hypothetical protein